MAVPGIGTAVNVVAIALGSGLGWTVGQQLPQRVSEIVLQGIGLIVLVVGMQMALTASSAAQFSIAIVSMVLGAVTGELMNIEHWLTRLGQAIEWWVSKRFGPNPITKAFITSSLLFLVGPMAILGGIQDGLLGDPSLLLIKSGLDGIVSIAFTASLGIGTLFSTIPIAIYQGAWTFLGIVAGDVVNESAVDALTATGGLVVMGIGFNLLQVTQLRLGNFLPALLFAGAIAGWTPGWTLEL